jgi:hypothetical protein
MGIAQERIKAYVCSYKVTVIAFGKNAGDAHRNGAQVLDYAEEVAGPLREDLVTDAASYTRGAVIPLDCTPLGYPARSPDHDAKIVGAKQ